MLSLPKSIRIFFTYIPVNPHWWLENPGTLMAFTRKETWFFHDRYQSPSSAMWKERPFFRFSTLGSFWSSKRTFVFFWTFSFLEKTCSFWTDTNVHMEKTGHCADLLWTRYLWPLHRQKKVIHDHPPIGPVLARINEAYEYTFVSHVGSRRKHDFFPTKIYPFEKFLSFLSNFGIDVFYREHDYPNDLLVDSQSPFALAKGLLLGSPKKKNHLCYVTFSVDGAWPWTDILSQFRTPTKPNPFSWGDYPNGGDGFSGNSLDTKVYFKTCSCTTCKWLQSLVPLLSLQQIEV